MKEIYLDWAATALPDPEAVEEQRRVGLEAFANPSSLHSPGKKARTVLEEARAKIARGLKTKPDRITFCSGGTEANHIALSSLLCRQGNPLLLTTRVEHPSIYECALGLGKRGISASFLKTDGSGRIDLSGIDLDAARKADMLAVSAVNNEIGAIQDLKSLVEALRAPASGKKIHIHVDAVQAFGKIEFLPDSLGVDSASFSAHKLGGPRGIGFLWTARPMEAFMRGGGQENGVRSGTENTAGAAAAAMALGKSLDGLEMKIASARDRIELVSEGILSLGGTILPHGRLQAALSFSPWILQAALPPIPGEALVRFLSDSHCAISTGSACSSSRKGRRVLDSLGVDPSLSRCAFRISQGPSTTRGEMGDFLVLLKDAVSRLKVAANG